ncbi:AGAP002705-PA-like protein [Anopheles sinensis]|uniref:AGAP002705-PA-like protein n=1 Tax=Anopheles sinensis TaxID=74873 RepID=A0A084VB75_ANOSI|nr:AGAP002705-PA-like protein [Anopheles sinensis]
MITSISSNKILPHDNFPTKLCYPCAELLRNAYGFLQTCSSSYITLLKCVQQPNEENDCKVQVESVQVSEDTSQESTDPDDGRTEENGEDLMDARIPDSGIQMPDNDAL